jgi:cyanate permease
MGASGLKNIITMAAIFWCVTVLYRRNLQDTETSVFVSVMDLIQTLNPSDRAKIYES